VNHKKCQRLWREEGLRVKVNTRRKRTGRSTTRALVADAPDVVWAIDFQFDRTTDDRPIKIANVIDEHTRQALGGQFARSIIVAYQADQLDWIVVITGVARQVTEPDRLSRYENCFSPRPTSPWTLPSASTPTSSPASGSARLAHPPQADGHTCAKHSAIRLPGTASSLARTTPARSDKKRQQPPAARLPVRQTGKQPPAPCA
jgi:transposase InsO family protein